MFFKRSIFLTGFPGFIASRLLEHLATHDTQFFLLVQSQLVEKAMEEIAEIAEATNTDLDNYAIIEGDITLPNLGIASEDWETILYDTTDVFHLAAVYDLSIDKETAMRVNFEGTRNVNDLVTQLKNLKRYNYVSTCYVAGKRTGEILETELEHNAGFRNFYEESKYLAEMEVEKLKDKYPVTIYRPSVVVGDSNTGETTKYDGIYYLIHYLRKAPVLLRIFNVGNNEVRLNLVPVDFVVDAIVALSNDKKAVRKTIALADPNPLTTAALFDAIAKDMTGRKSEITPPKRLVEWFLNTRISPRITGLPHFGVPYFFVSQTYNTSVAANLLRPHMITCPNFRYYVGKLLDFVEEFPRL